MGRRPANVNNVLPLSSRRYTTEQRKSSSVVDLFRSPGEIAPKNDTRSCQDYLNSKSVYARNWTAPTYRNTANTFSSIVKNEDLKEARLVDNDDRRSMEFPLSSSNRVEYFYNIGDGKKVGYNEITKVEEVEPSAYGSDTTNHLKKIGFTKFYQLYKKSDMNPNVESKLSILAVR